MPPPRTAVPPQGCRPYARGNRRLVTEPETESYFSSLGISVRSKPRGMRTAQQRATAPAAHSRNEAHSGTSDADPGHHGGKRKIVLSQGQSCIFRLGNKCCCFAVVVIYRQETIIQQLRSISLTLSLNCTFASASTCRVGTRRKVKWGCLSGR